MKDAGLSHVQGPVSPCVILSRFASDMPFQLIRLNSESR
jgi:hypothetical protein